MSRWEDKYNKFMPNIENMINQENTKINEARRKKAEIGKDVNSEEYKQAKADLKEAKMEKDRLEQLKPNLAKVKNIMEFRKQVELRLNEYYKAKDTHNKIDSNKKKIERRQKKYEKASETIKDLTAKLQSGTLSQSEKIKVNMQITKATNEKQEAFKDTVQLKQENDSLSDELKGMKYGDLDKKEINEQIQNLGATIVKCDMACSNLMNGKKIEDLQFDKSKHKYTRPKEQTEVTPKEQKEYEENELFDENYILKDNKKEKIYNDEYEDISSKSTFADRHPRLAKIGNFFRNLKDRIFNRNKALELEEGTPLEHTDKEEVVKETIEEEKIGLTDKEMDRMAQEILADNAKLEELGSKGTNSFRDNIKVTLSKEAKERLDKFRKDNGYRQGDTGPTMTQKGRDGLNKIDRTVQEINDGGREPGE